MLLGYPLDDVKDFIENKKDCKLIGTWKVYNNIEEAKQKFREYKCITNLFCEQLTNNDLIDIIKNYKGEKC